MRNSQAVTLGSLEDRYLVLRHPLVRTEVPKAKGIVLINRPVRSELSFPSNPMRVELKQGSTDTNWERVIQVILDKPLQDRANLVVVVGGRVFWDLGGEQRRDGGWISWGLAGRDEPERLLRDAMRIFGVEEQQVLDLRLTEEERARVPTVTGQLSPEEVSEIRRTVFAMAQWQIMKRLAVSGVSRQGWNEEWPGRRELTIEVIHDGRGAVVYYAPNAGYQMERLNGKWAIVGG